MALRSDDAAVACLSERAGRVLDANACLQAALGELAASSPALNLLLFLMAEDRGRGVTTTRCCASVQVPRTTALRWIGTLAAAGLVEQREDGSDRRVTLLSLAPVAYAALRIWLDQMCGS